ncbi:sulfate transporter family protein [Chelatococcus sambhunathii]|uniref:Sulfate transporter family protein n=1 Tax=Chelatococcus sambhunathii TaxID=363953 RepID=A0ABU1DL29_9HYPH|nr:sulfate transporter family protein [Chelatococcus sambhunathii]MDR4308585.1 sulfate transporter family protein [Chelatococcus sambhunathii]
MLSDALLAARQTLSPPFRTVLLKSLGITVLLLVVGWIGLQELAERLLVIPNQTANWIAHIVLGLGTALGLLFLVTPITAAVAGLFLDDVAALVERTHYPQDPPGQELPIVRSLWISARFFLVVLGLNILLLPLIFVPVVNVVAWVVANGYLLSREYFSLAALRFRPEAEATALRRRNRLRIMAAGALVAGLAALPFANLLTPLFATAFFVHLHKRISAEEARRLEAGGSAARLGP